MSKAVNEINDLINMLEDGRQFYKDAAGEVDRPDLKALFTRMAQSKTLILNDLKTTVTFKGEEPSEGSFAGSVRKLYADIRTKLASDSDAEYVSQLEEFEDRILEEFRKQSKDSDNGEVRSIALRYLSEVQKDHDEMRALKKQMN